MNKKINIEQKLRFDPGFTRLSTMWAKDNRRVKLMDYLKEGEKWKAPILHYRKTGDKSIKAGLPVIIPAVFTRKGHLASDSNIIGFTGWSSFDIDGLKPKKMKRLKCVLQDDPYIAFMMASVSGKGLWGLVIFEPGAYAMRYLALISYFRNTYGIDLDPSSENLTRLRYISYDPEPYMAKEVSVFSKVEVDPGRVLSADGNSFERWIRYPKWIPDHKPIIKKFNDSNQCSDILEAHGWDLVKSDYRDRDHYIRPGSTSHATSGNLWENIFYSFTDATNLRAKMEYRPFDLYVALECDGDYEQAIKNIDSSARLRSDKWVPGSFTTFKNY